MNSSLIVLRRNVRKGDGKATQNHLDISSKLRYGEYRGDLIEDRHKCLTNVCLRGEKSRKREKGRGMP